MKAIKLLASLLLICTLIYHSPVLQSRQDPFEPPQRYFPYDGEINVSITPTLIWLNHESADYYRVWIEGTNFDEICDQSHITVPKEYLLEGYYYKWRIQAFTNDGLASEISTPWSFRTQYVRRDLPEEPILCTPFYDQMDVSVHTDFTWYGGNRANGYQLIIREADENRDLVWKSGIIQSSSIIAPYGVLERNKRYAWSMVSINEKGSSPESPPFFFYTVNK